MNRLCIESLERRTLLSGFAAADDASLIYLQVHNSIKVPMDYPIEVRFGDFSEWQSVYGPFSASVHWGDGTPDTEFTPSVTTDYFLPGLAFSLTAPAHVFSSLNTWQATVTVSNLKTGEVSSAPSTLHVVPLSMPRSHAGDQTAFAATAKQIELGSVNAQLVNDPLSTVVDWGDGKTDTPYTLLAAMVHTYDVIGNYHVTINDTDGTGTVHTFSSFQVAVTTGVQVSQTTLTTSASDVFRDYPETLTASLFPNTATGLVRFFANGNLIGQVKVVDGVATLITKALPQGMENVTADYSGSATFLPSASESVQVNVVAPQNETSLALSAGDSAIAADQKLHLTANLSPVASIKALGTVTFSIADTVLGVTNVVNNVADFTTITSLPFGSDAITAVYNGDGVYSVATSNSVEVDVVKAKTIFTLSSDRRRKTPNQPIFYTATIESTTPPASRLAAVYPNTPASIREDSDQILGGKIIGPDGTATVITANPTATGQHQIDGYYAGDSVFEPSTSASILIEVAPPKVEAIVTFAGVPSWFATGSKERYRVGVQLEHAVLDADDQHLMTFGIYAATSDVPGAIGLNDQLIGELVKSFSERQLEKPQLNVVIPVAHAPISSTERAFQIRIQVIDWAGNVQTIETSKVVKAFATTAPLTMSFAHESVKEMKHGVYVALTNVTGDYYGSNVHFQFSFKNVYGASQGITGTLTVANLRIPAGQTRRVFLFSWKKVAVDPYSFVKPIVEFFDNDGNTAAATFPGRILPQNGLFSDE